jgi:putative toxin-antitoxin system antitoxin component (TIGR02293 family)
MSHAPLAQVLGGRRTFGAHEPRTPSDWHGLIQSGVPARAAFLLKDQLGLRNEELARLLGLSTRSMTRLAAARALDPVVGDRLYRLARLYALASEVLEDEAAAVRWLRSPQRALSGALPLERAATDAGAREVEVLLGRMEHGVFA